MTAIDQKHQDLGGETGFLGEPQGPESALPDGGAFRDYANGSIYWTQLTGARYVAGAIRDKWIAVSAQNGLLGYPISDEYFTRDQRGRRSDFQHGAVLWSPETGAHLVCGGIQVTWEECSGKVGALGYPLSDEANIAWGTGRYSLFERGAAYWSPEAGVQLLSLLTPQLGCPAFVELRPSPLRELVVSAPILGEAFVRQARREGPSLIRQLWSDRLSLRRVDRSESNILLEALDYVIGATPNANYLSAQFRPNRPLTERALYDICFTTPEGHTLALAPHSVYSRSAWESFGMAHASDIHVSRRIDGFAERLIELGLPDGASNVCNFNDRLRLFVRHANRLYEQGRLDIVLMTGDLVDYVFEDDDPRSGSGNFRLLEDIICGLSPSPSGVVTEELRVPIVTSLGNHDYRANAYPVAFELTKWGIGLEEMESFSAFNLTLREGVALSGGSWVLPNATNPSLPVYADLPNESTSTAKRFLSLEPGMLQGTAPYFRRINRARSYIVRLGSHRLVMLDTGPDEGVPLSDADALWAHLGNGSEDKIALVGGSPNSVGVNAADLGLVGAALDEAGKQGLVIVGMHAPPLNIRSNEYNYYFRETEHPTSDWRDTVGFLFRHGAGYFDDPPSMWNTDRGVSRDWTRTGVSYFKTGDTANLLDEGVSRGSATELLRVCAGLNGRRRSDAVLFGHVHRHVEFRVEPANDGTLRFYHDHYCDNPKEYYSSIASDNGYYRQHRTVRVFIDANVQPRDQTHLMTDEAAGHFKEEWRRAVPLNPSTLNSSPDPQQWWNDRRPLLLQTAALGPLDSNQRPDRRVRPDREVDSIFRCACHAPNRRFRGFA